MIGDPSHVALKVLEAADSDVGLGRARVDADTRKALGLTEGEIVEIVGLKPTAAKLFRLSQEDEGKGIIRIDGLVRRNLGVSIGDKVDVRKAEVLPGERVTIAPIISEGHRISFGQGIENFVKRSLLKRAVTKGDLVIVPGIALMGGALPFAVVATSPSGIVSISPDTEVEVSDIPVAEADLFSPESRLETYSADLRGFLEARLRALEDELSQLEGDSRVRTQRIISAMRVLLVELEEPSPGTSSEGGSET